MTKSCILYESFQISLFGFYFIYIFLISSFKALFFLEFEYQVLEFFQNFKFLLQNFMVLFHFFNFFYFIFFFDICSSKRKCFNLDVFEHFSY